MNSKLLFEHLVELKATFIKSIIFFVFIILILMPFSNDLYSIFADPLLEKFMVYEGSIVSTKLTSTFFVPFKITLFCSLIISFPFIFYQFWSFIAPGLYLPEKKFLAWTLCLAYFLFVFASIFVYFLVFPIIFEFFIKMTPENVTLMIDISYYLELIISLFFAFGLAFQVPLIVSNLVRFNWIKISDLKKYRAYFLLFAFLFGAIFTPPDVISQIMLAVPVYFLYEIGIFFAKAKN
ncbi:MAG: twin-arginine translocase subunit TatC [Methylophilaceae bacterium]